MLIIYEFPNNPTLENVEREMDCVPRQGDTVQHRGDTFKVLHVIFNTSNHMCRVILDY